MYVDNLNVFLKYGQLLVKVREFCSTIAAPSINNHHFNKKDSTVDSTQCSAEIQPENQTRRSRVWFEGCSGPVEVDGREPRLINY